MSQKEVKMISEVRVKNKKCDHPECNRWTDIETSSSMRQLRANTFAEEGWTLDALFFKSQDDPQWPEAGAEIVIHGSYWFHDMQSVKGFFCPDCYLNKVLPVLLSLGMKMNDHEGEL